MSNETETSADTHKVHVLAPSAGEGWDAWGKACRFTSWDEAAKSIGITRAQLINNRKKPPRKTIRLAMDAVLLSIIRKEYTPMVMLPERPAPSLGQVDGANAYSGVQMLAFGRDCAEEQRAAGTAIDVDVISLVEAAKHCSATLGHAYHTVLVGELAEMAHTDYQRLDAAIARVVSAG